MINDYPNLRPLCMAVAASDFSRADRLKAIIQIAYEVLGASSIIAYKYDRLSERLLIFAMPGVMEREIMRGPTPEPIFAWEEVSPSRAPLGRWLENSEEYRAYMASLPKQAGVRRKAVGEDFRARELRKHGGKGDLSLAKICLYKGEGQTLDRVGQIFLNFHKLTPNERTFSEELRSAIWFVAKLIRELLIEELYHTGKSQFESDRGPAGSLHLLRVIDEKLKPAVAVTLNSLHELDPDLLRLLCQHIAARVRELEAEKKGELPDLVQTIRSSTRKRLQDLQQRLSLRSGLQAAQPSEDLGQTLRAILPEALSRELWHLVCRAALEIVETYGGQADIILIVGDRIGKRIQPAHMGPTGELAYLWLDPQTVTGDCLQRAKVFACNNVLEKGSQESKQRFRSEPYIEQYNSLLVVPVTIEGEIRAVLRMMSTDKDCFLDRHTQAIEDMAFVTSYALNVLDSRQRRDHITGALAYFAEGQAVAEQPSVEQLLRRSLRVLGAEYAVFWPVEMIREQEAIFGRGIVVNAFGEQHSLHIQPDDPRLGIRADGFTQRICHNACTFDGHFLFCHHVVEHLQSLGKQRHRNPRVKYVLQVFAERLCPWMEGAELTTEGFYKRSSDSTQPFPGCDAALDHNSRPGAHLHSRIGFPIREKESGRVGGIAWICFSDLHHLDWSERLFICALSNYLAQAMKADGLRLAIRSFRHMIPGKTDAAIAGLKWAGRELKFAVGDLHPEDLEMASAKAADVLFMVRRKADEVNALLRGSQQFPFLSLQEVFSRSWTIATDLACPCRPGTLNKLGPFVTEEQNGLMIFYENEDIARSEVIGALYTAAVNILSNARIWGAEPYCVWVSSRKERIRLVFANGGKPPEPAVVSLHGMPASSAEEHGVGLAVVGKILSLIGGSLRLLTGEVEILDCVRTGPELLKRCNTFFEVELPHNRKEPKHA